MIKNKCFVIRRVITELIILFILPVIFFSSIALATIHFEAEYLENIRGEYGEYAKRRLVAWEKLIIENQDKPTQKKLELVNQFFNLIRFKTDMQNWGFEDYWATPIELLVSNGGDCEDYAIAKYFTLRELGISEEKLLITYVQALDYNQAHMVVTYYETKESIPLVLDNLIGEILPANKRKDLKPIYSFNGSGLWQSKQQGLGKQLGEPTDLKQWSDMRERMQSGKIGKFRRE